MAHRRLAGLWFSGAASAQAREYGDFPSGCVELQDANGQMASLQFRNAGRKKSAPGSVTATHLSALQMAQTSIYLQRGGE
jgi:hypothetical protein